LGAYFQLWDLAGPLQVYAGMKAGVYGNSASHRFNMYHSAGVSIPSATDGQTTSFAGEIQVTASYQLTSFAAVRFGYQMLWVDRLALSSDELARATFLLTHDGIGLNGDVFYHGATGGIEFSW